MLISIAGCETMGQPSSKLPDADRNVLSYDPATSPDIRWQTPDQRKILSDKMIDAQNAASDIKWKDEVNTAEQQAVAAKTTMTDKEYEELYKELANEEALKATIKANREKIKVHLLVPLTGNKSNLGKSMLNAAQMALFDVGSENFELVPVDTKSTNDGARAAAEKAIQDESKLILGPIFSQNLEAIKPVVSPTGIPVISFTTDWKQADDNVYLMGFLPFTQVSRVVKYAQQNGYHKFAAYAPQTEYADIVIRTMDNAIDDTKARMVDSGRFPAQQRDVSELINAFATAHKDDKNGFDFDTLMLPMGGESLKSVVKQFELNGVVSTKIKFIGTGLWDEDNLVGTPSMMGAWFAAPDPDVREDFVKNYRDNFGSYPVRIASLAYDATALAAVLARSKVDDLQSPYTHDNLTNPRGFAGIDGVFRFREDGLSERGLAILEVSSGKMKVVDKAPTSFIIESN